MSVTQADQRQPTSWLRAAVTVAGIAYMVLVVAAQAEGSLSGRNLVVALGFPLAVAVGVLAPKWALLALLAIPPGYLVTSGDLNIRLVTAMLVMLGGLQAIRSRRLPGRVLAYLAPLIAIIVLSLFHVSDESTFAAEPASVFRSLLVFVVVLAVFTYMLVRDGEVHPTQVADAILIGVTITAVIFLFQTGFQPWTLTTRSFGDAVQPGLLGYRTHFGYVMCIGFCIVMARSARVVSDDRPWWAPWIAAFLGLMTILSFTRGAWVAALIYVIAVPLRTGRRGIWIAAGLVVAIALTFPVIQDRLVSGATGGVGEAIRSNEFATGRLDLWNELGELAQESFPQGRGFGYAFSLTPQEVLGVEAFTSGRNPFVYPHNDFLYAALDFGVAGFLLLVAFWIVAIGMYFRARYTHAWLFGGVLLTMFIASLVDNGIFIRPVLERFMVAVAVIAAMYATRLREPSSPA